MSSTLVRHHRNIKNRTTPSDRSYEDNTKNRSTAPARKNELYMVSVYGEDRDMTMSIPSVSIIIIDKDFIPSQGTILYLAETPKNMMNHCSIQSSTLHLTRIKHTNTHHHSLQELLYLHHCGNEALAASFF